MIRIEIFYTSYRLRTQTVAPTLPGFQVMNIYIKDIATQPHKPILYLLNCYDGAKLIILTWS